MRKMIAIACLLAATAAELSAQDIIRFKEGAKNQDMEGSIATMTYKLVEIEINIGGTLTKQPADARQIADLIPSNSNKTFDFAQGEVAMANGDFDSASERFERVKKDQRASELQKQLAGINIVRSQYYKGSPTGTASAAQAMRAWKADSFYTRESFVLEVKAYIAMRDANRATGALKAFAAKGNADGMQEWAKSADLMEAELAELKGNFRDALTIYKKYSRDHDVGEDATLGEMRSLTALSDWTSLNSRADSIISDAKGKKNYNSRLLIAAYNGKGDMDMNGSKVKEALLDYLQGAIVLSKGETSPEHEASLSRCSIACAKIATAEKDKTKKDTYRNRALEMLAELDKTYPKSPKRADAEKAIKEVK